MVRKDSWAGAGGKGHPVPYPHPFCVSGSVMESSTHPVASPYAFLVTGGSLLLGIALFVGIVVR